MHTESETKGGFILTQERQSLAQMAELVDALVSNTNTSRCTGSSPVLGTSDTSSPLQKHICKGLFFFRVFMPHYHQYPITIHSDMPYSACDSSLLSTRVSLPFFHLYVSIYKVIPSRATLVIVLFSVSKVGSSIFWNATTS